MSEDRKKELRCSFCGKSEHEVHRMIQGPGVRICDECVRLCMDVLEDGYEPHDELEAPDSIPTPRARFLTATTTACRRSRSAF